MFVTSMATFALSLVVVKVLFLALFLLASIVNGALASRFVVYPRLVTFYLAICVAGIVWAIVGLLHHGNDVMGAFDALRLYVIWSVAFLVLYSLLRSEPSLGLIHASMVVT